MVVLELEAVYAQAAPHTKLLNKRFVGAHHWLGPLKEALVARLVADKVRLDFRSPSRATGRVSRRRERMHLARVKAVPRFSPDKRGSLLLPRLFELFFRARDPIAIAIREPQTRFRDFNPRQSPRSQRGMTASSKIARRVFAKELVQRFRRSACS